MSLCRIEGQFIYTKPVIKFLELYINVFLNFGVTHQVFVISGKERYIFREVGVVGKVNKVKTIRGLVCVINVN